MKIGKIRGTALAGALAALGACAVSFPDYTEGPIGAGGATASSSSSSSSTSASTSASTSSSSGTGGVGGMGGASSSSSSATSASSSSSSSSSGSGGGCAQPTDCTGLPPDDACQTRTCIASTCGQTFQPSNTQVPGIQTNGDCKLIVCDGAGKQITITDGADLPNDNNACTTDTCNGQTPVNTSLPQGTSCGAASVCDGAPVNPKCEGCNGPMDCAGYVNDDCKQTTCLGGNCSTNFTGAGTPTANQAPGNCKTNVCDGAGNAHDVVAAGDVPVDGNPCTFDICTAGVPSNPPLLCTALDPCHAAGTCSGGACSNPPKGNGTVCNDGNVCTLNDVCSGGVCAGTANGGGCSDGNACTTADVCMGDTCSGTAVVCTAMDACHTAGTCSGGICSNPVKSCGNYACNAGTGCLLACASDSDCAAAAYCDGAASCHPQKSSMDACNSVVDCKVMGCKECAGAAPCPAGSGKSCP